MPFHYGSRHGQKIEWIVIHYPVAPGCTAKWCCDYYNRTNEKKSAHFAICDNDVQSIVPCNFAAYHCATSGCVVKCTACNRNSIGIDLMDNKLSKKTMSVCDDDWYISEKTLSVAVGFIADLMCIYHIDIDHVVRHYDVTGKLCPRPLVGDDINKYYGTCGNERWDTFKQQIKDHISTYTTNSALQ